MRTLVIILLVLTTVCASAAKKAKAPREFVTQILEPTGGKIQRPKGCFEGLPSTRCVHRELLRSRGR